MRMAGGNQQFCLRWNNHQSTLVSVFDSLLESGTLVDCTLAAEGQYLKAHKVVLSACSPYLESLLSQHYEKHPILILKDVSFIELKAMLDYMYRGEVNISQEQLGTFLKAAESLQIKGLTDSSSNSSQNNDLPPKMKPKMYVPAAPQPAPRVKSPQAFPQGLIVEPRPFKLSTLNNNNNNNNEVVRDGSVSPKQQHRSKRRRSVETREEQHLLSSPPPPPIVECSESPLPLEVLKAEPRHPTDPPDCNNDIESADEKPFDDDDDEDFDSSKPGPSNAPNSHSSGVWNTSADVSAEEMFTPSGTPDQESKVVARPLVASLKAVNTYMARLNTTVTLPPQSAPTPPPNQAANRSSIQCPNCHKCYSSQHTLRRHMRLECGKEPQFHCPYCPRKTKQRYNLMLHIARAHKPDHTLQYKN